jgi:hypothetical protein
LHIDKERLSDRIYYPGPVGYAHQKGAKFLMHFDKQSLSDRKRTARPIKSPQTAIWMLSEAVDEP